MLRNCSVISIESTSGFHFAICTQTGTYYFLLASEKERRFVIIMMMIIVMIFFFFFPF